MQLIIMKLPFRLTSTSLLMSSRFLLLGLLWLCLAIPPSSINDAFIITVKVAAPINKIDVGRLSSTLFPIGEQYQYGGSGSDDRDRRGGAGNRRSGSGGGGRGGRGGRAGGGRGRGRGSRSSSSSSSSTRPNIKKQPLGPNGHDYQQSTDSIEVNNSMFTESDIHTLLAKRLQAKFDRDFNTADDIQMELINGGVYIQDDLREWRADGVPYENGGAGSGGSGRRGRNDNNDMQYTKSTHSSQELPQDVSESLIQKLVFERAKYKFTRQYDKADLVREGLRSKFDVIIDDRLRQWSVGGDFGSEHNAVRESLDLLGNRGYIKSSSSLAAIDYNNSDDNDGDEEADGDDADDGKEMEEYIQHHVDARAAMKKEGKFDAADKIRLDLAQR